MTEKLKKYIEKRLNEGFSEEEVRRSLRKTKYDEETIEEAFSKVGGVMRDGENKTDKKSQRFLYFFFTALIAIGLIGVFYIDGFNFGFREDVSEEVSLRFEPEESEDQGGFNLTIFLRNPTDKELKLKGFEFTGYRNQTPLSEFVFTKDELKENPAFFNTSVPPGDERKIYEGIFTGPQDPEYQVPGKRKINYRIITSDYTIEKDFKYEVQYPDNAASYTFF